MDREDFLKEAKEIIEFNYEKELSIFKKEADKISSIVNEKKSFFEKAHFSMLNDFSDYKSEIDGSSHWSIKKTEVTEEYIKNFEIRKIFDEGVLFKKPEDYEYCDGISFSLKFIDRKKSNVISINQDVNFDGLVRNHFSKEECSMYSLNGEIKEFYYFLNEKSAKSSFFIPMINLLDSMLDSLYIKDKWIIDYVSLKENKDLMVLKKPYKHNGADLVLSIEKKINEHQSLLFFSKDDALTDSINSTIVNHDFEDLISISDLVDLNVSY